MNVTAGIFACDDIGLFEGCLSSSRYSLRMVRRHRLVRGVNILSDEVAYLILTLSEDTTCAAVLQTIGRSVLIASTARLILLLCATVILRVPSIPICWVVYLIGQHITRVVAHVVARTVNELERNILLLLHMVDRRVSSLQGIVISRQHHRTSRDESRILATILAVSDGDVCLIDKQVLLRAGQQVPIPVVDRIVQVILHIVDDHLLAFLEFHARSRPIGILVRHHVEQFHRTMRSGRDGQWDVHRLAICVRCSGICRDILVVDIYRTLDEPVVCGNGIRTAIPAADIIAVVNNRLRTVDEVS